MKTDSGSELLDKDTGHRRGKHQTDTWDKENAEQSM
jgi:hypothetical protein